MRAQCCVAARRQPGAPGVCCAPGGAALRPRRVGQGPLRRLQRQLRCLAPLPAHFSRFCVNSTAAAPLRRRLRNRESARRVRARRLAEMSQMEGQVRPGHARG